jgi:hypothetical protein
MCCVGLHYHAEGSHFSTDGQGSFCKEHHTVVAAHRSKGFAFIVVLRGMNSTWMNPSLSQNRDAVNFPVDWQAFNFLPVGEIGSFRCIPRCLTSGVKWNIHVWLPDTAVYSNWLYSFLNRRKLETTISKLRFLCSVIRYLGSKLIPNLHYTTMKVTNKMQICRLIYYS